MGPVYPRFDGKLLMDKADQGIYLSTQYLNSPIDEGFDGFLPIGLNFYEREPEGLTNYIIVAQHIGEESFSCVSGDGTGYLCGICRINPSQLIEI